MLERGRRVRTRHTVGLFQSQSMFRAEAERMPIAQMKYLVSYRHKFRRGIVPFLPCRTSRVPRIEFPIFRDRKYPGFQGSGFPGFGFPGSRVFDIPNLWDPYTLSIIRSLV